MKKRLLLLIALVVSVVTTSAQLAPHSNAALLPQSATTPMLAGTAQLLSAAQGNQTNPHVACNIATYTYDDFEGSSTIRYFDFATNTEHVVPGNNLDRLSSTDGQRIAFTELGIHGDQIFVYDTVSQTTTIVPGDGDFLPALGGNLVAYVHGSPFEGGGYEIRVYERDTGTVTQLTNDDMMDRNPAVSPDGKTILWQKCRPNQIDCDVYSATQTGPGAFTTRVLTGAGEDTSPDTNGQVIVYLSDKNGGNDVYIQRVDGSNEMHLAIPGDQRDLRIAGNLVVFESQTLTGWDVFLYDLSTARLFQVTNTPGVDETLSDVVAGCDGVNRIVYAVPGSFGDFDAWQFTFQLDDSVQDQLNDLIALVQSFNISEGTKASLISKLQDVIAAVNASDTPKACDSLTAFINASQAQSGKKLTAAQVRQLVDAAALIKSDLGCN